MKFMESPYYLQELARLGSTTETSKEDSTS